MPQHCPTCGSLIISVRVTAGVLQESSGGSMLVSKRRYRGIGGAGMYRYGVRPCLWMYIAIKEDQDASIRKMVKADLLAKWQQRWNNMENGRLTHWLIPDGSVSGIQKTRRDELLGHRSM